MATTTRVMTTVLPYSFASDSKFHVSVLFSHRLAGSAKLSDYPAIVNWVKSLNAATTKFTLHINDGVTVLCTPQLGVTKQSVWEQAFPADSTTVAPFPDPNVTQNRWESYPAHRTPDHAFDAHNASACASPVSRPAVSTAPLAAELLTTFGDIEGLRELIAALRNYRNFRDRILNNLENARTDAVQGALSPKKPDPDTGDSGGGGPHVGPGDGGLHLEPEGNDTSTALPPSPIDLLLSARNVDSRITSYVAQLDDSTANTPIKKMLRDVHASVGYYHRPEEQPHDADNLAAAAAPPRTAHPDPDFHERAAAACNVKTLARVLGLVVDLTVDKGDLAKLATAKKIWCDVEIDGTERYVSPITLCTTSGTHLLAEPREPARWAGGRLRLGDDDKYRVLDLDPDAGGMSLEQLLRSVLRALAIEANGDGGSFAPPSVRATGFSVAEIGRPDRLKVQLDNSPKGEPALAQSGQPGPELKFENLLRGTRLEVWDDFTQTWHSLHERSVTALFGKKEIFKADDDIGHLQNPPLSQVPGDAANNPFYVHEVLAGWDGWSLSAPRPGKLVIHNPSDHEEPGKERIDDTPESTDKPGLGVRSTAKRGSLPALRYGTRYSFRIAGVDLAGNSVPMNTDLPPEVSESQIQASTTYLDGVRAKTTARDNASLTADLRKQGKLQAPTLGTGSGVRAEAERAMASVIETASSVRTRPELDTSPEELARLIADADDAATITVPKPYLRWDPITAPTFVPRVAYVTGESLQRMVIRTGLTSAPGVTERHIVPPKGSELEAEQDGRLDKLMREHKVAQAYAIALKERGSLFYKEVQDIGNPKGKIVQPRIKLLSMPNVTEPKTLEEIQDPEVQPAAGQYIVHDVDNLLVPYLPDPMADGVALVFYEAGADHKFTNPRVLQSVTLKYAGDWPLLQPLRLVLHSAPRLDAEQVGNVIHVGLPPGEQVGVKVSSTLDDAHLNKMGLWVTSPINDPNVPEADREVLAAAARDGWLWWLTPDEDLRLVHATARPAVAPKISRLTAKPRTANVVNANLDGVLDVHGASTDKVELRAQWTEQVDDPNSPEPVSRTTREVVVKHSIKENERFSMLTLNPNAAKDVGTRKAEVPLRRAVHTLPDTKARKVTYQLHGSSRYREFFVPDELPKPDDAESLGNEVEVNIQSSAIPSPPVVRDVIPMFLWEHTTEPEHPFAIRRSRRSGVRIWLDRPWYSSGGGEMLAIIATGDLALAKDKTDSVSLWARDPILVSSKIENSYEVPVLTAWQQRAVQLNLAPESLPARPQLHVVKPGSPTTGDKVINAYAYTPEFDKERKRWFVDAVFESAGANWPFLRLAVARYQPNSIAGMEFSKVVATDFIQLPPERIGTLSRPDKDHVRVSITGVTSATNAPGLTLPDTRPDTPGRLAPLVTKSHRVVATLQARSKMSGSDLEWASGAEVPCELAGVDATTFKATWTAELALEPPQQLLTPGDSDDLRVQIEEYEILSADETPGTAGLTPTERLVYADHFYL